MPHLGNSPLVCGIMLTKDRPEMARRAVESFRAQTYPNKRLLVWDTGELAEYFDTMEDSDPEYIAHVLAPAYRQISIGQLRNEAIRFWNDYDIVVTWDSDDYSHPNRIAEQVEHLQSSGADVVGYNELLFWRVTKRTRIATGTVQGMMATHSSGRIISEDGEAWLYKHRTNAPGTTLCYWRKTWERKPFPDLNNGEDYHWLQGLKLSTDSSLPVETFDYYRDARGASVGVLNGLPRMIASIHGGNTLPYDIEGQIERGSREWTRVPAWDSYCAKKMKL